MKMLTLSSIFNFDIKMTVKNACRPYKIRPSHALRLKNVRPYFRNPFLSMGIFSSFLKDSLKKL